MEVQNFKSFAEFWPFYLSQHSNAMNRRFHFIGTALALVIVADALSNSSALILILAPILGYGFAWVGHFRIEKNRPATFQYPAYSLWGDFKLFGMMLTGKYWT